MEFKLIDACCFCVGVANSIVVLQKNYSTNRSGILMQSKPTDGLLKLIDPVRIGFR
jgi:hypothetical protein